MFRLFATFGCDRPEKVGFDIKIAKANASAFLTFDDGQGGLTASSSIHRQLESG